MCQTLMGRMQKVLRACVLQQLFFCCVVVMVISCAGFVICFIFFLRRPIIFKYCSVLYQPVVTLCGVHVYTVIKGKKQHLMLD